MFNANNWGNSGVNGDKLSTFVPPEFYKTASIVKPYVKLKFDLTILLLFVVFQGLVLLFLWVLWAWAALTARKMPVVSSFPLYDFLFKPGFVIAEASREEIWNAGGAQVLDIIGGAKVVASRPA